MTFILAALLFSADAAPKAYRTPGIPETVTLENGLVKFTFVPSLNGMVSAWEYLPQKRSFIPPLRYRVVKTDLLPDQVFASPDGFRCRFWGGNTRIFDGMQIKKLSASPSEGSQLVLETPSCGGVEVAQKNQMRLLPDSTILEGVVRMTNGQQKTFSCSLWFNSLFYMSDVFEPVIVPVRSQTGNIGNFGITPARKSGILEEAHKGNRNMYFAALRPWLARKVPGKRGIIVLQIEDPDMENLVLYTHKDGNLHTMEIIASPEKLAPGKSCSRKFRLICFPSLAGLREIRDSYGINIAKGALEIESALPVKQTEWIINGKRYKIPALKPGMLHKIKLGPALREPLKIKTGKTQFLLPEFLGGL